MRRDLLLTALLAAVLLAIVPAYDTVFTTTAWRGPALGAGLIALAVAALLRRLHVPWLLSSPVSLLALLLALPWLLTLGDGWTAGFAAQWEVLRAAAGEGWLALAEEPAPAEPLPGLMLLTALAWWVTAHVAHEVTVRSGQAAPALVSLTALWVLPLAIPVRGAGDGLLLVVPFLLTAGAVLLATYHAREGSATIALPASGLVLLGGAVVVGVAAPWLLPGYDRDALIELGSSGSSRGYQPIVDISNRLGSPVERDVLRVRSSQRTYLRLAGLDSFDGATWRLGPPGESTYRPDPAQLYPADQPLPPEEPAASSQLVEVDVEVLELENIYVPLPYQPVEVLGPIRSDMVWSTQGGFLATWDRTETVGETIGIREGSAYRVLAERPTPTFEELSAVEFDDATLAANTQLPRDYPELGAQAEEVYERAGATSVVERALALQDWFVGPDGDFTYDLDVPALRGEDALTTFVLEDRVGYCEYFATAMAVMLRQTGIPARVAVGFLPGERVGEADPAAGESLDEYLVSSSDAHAWVEVLFPGHGWVTFEPTPRSDETHVLPREDDLAPIENEAERRERDELEGPDDGADLGADDPDSLVPDEPDLPEEDRDAAAEAEAAAGEGDGITAASGLLAVLLVLGLAGVLLVAGRRRAGAPGAATDPRGAVLAAQARLYRSARRVGLERRPEETVREALARWESEGRVDRGNAEVARIVQAAAFGGAVEPEQAGTAVATLDRLSTQMTERVRRRERLLVPLRRLRDRAGTLAAWLREGWQGR